MPVSDSSISLQCIIDRFSECVLDTVNNFFTFTVANGYQIFTTYSLSQVRQIVVGSVSGNAV